MGEKLKKLWQIGGTLFNADVKFDNGSPAVFFIDASLGKNEHGQPMLININNNKFFDIEFLNSDLGVNLIRKHDFPVTLIEAPLKGNHIN